MLKRTETKHDNKVQSKNQHEMRYIKSNKATQNKNNTRTSFFLKNKTKQQTNKQMYT